MITLHWEGKWKKSGLRKLINIWRQIINIYMSVSFFFFCLFSCINTADITLFRGGKHWWFREGVKSSIGWPVKRVLREIKTKNNDCWWEFVVSCLVDGRVDQVPIYFSSICCLEFSFVFESSISLQDEGNKGKKKTSEQRNATVVATKQFKILLSVFEILGLRDFPVSATVARPLAPSFVDHLATAAATAA